MALGLLVAASYSELVQMPTPFNMLWLIALGLALLLAIPVAIYSLWSRDRVLWLLVFISAAYCGVVLPPLLGKGSPVLPIAILKVLDWVFVALCISVSFYGFAKRRKTAKETTDAEKS
jgi:predicted membrane channel-forming protein YqfA (hemolysin III family)